MVQRVGEKISELDLLVPKPTDYFPFVSGSATKRGYASFGGAVFNVLAYATDADNATQIVAGLADPSAAFAAAASAASAVGGTIYVPAGTYGTGADWEFFPPSGVTVEGDGDRSVLVNCWCRPAGSLGSPISFTGATVKGDTVIPIPAAGLTNQWVRISGVINSMSPNAGINQLGTSTSEMSFFGEYARILSGGVSSATLDCRLVFPYSNTPGSDSGSFTTTVARVATFAENIRIRRLKFLGHNSTHAETIRPRFCRDLIIEDVTIDANDQITEGLYFEYCLDCKVINTRNIAKRTSVPVNSSTNGLQFVSCQNCEARGCLFANGYQGVDITFASNDSTYRGGPSLNCGLVQCTARDNERDGLTSHYGCYGCYFEACTVFAKLGGIRLRSRGDRAVNNRVFSTQAGNFGILIDDAATVDAVVAENYVEGGAEGIRYTHSLTGLLPLETALKCGSSLIKSNTVRGTADHGIFLDDAYTSAIMVGPRVEDNDIHSPAADGIHIGQYNNGTIVRGNRISGVSATRSGIRYDPNIKRLHIDQNHVYDVNAAGFAVSGAGVANAITDAVTFPGGNADAQHFIGTVYTDAASPYQSITRVTTAYALGWAAGWGSSGNYTNTPMVLRSSGTPEGSIYAPVGSLYLRSDGVAGTCLYIKESAGTSNTGWVAK